MPPRGWLRPSTLQPHAPRERQATEAPATTPKATCIVGWKTAQHFPRVATPPDKTQRWISSALSTLRLNFALCRWPQFRQDAFIRAESRGPEGGIHVGSSHLQENRDRRLVAQQRRRGHSQRHRRGEQDAGERRVVRSGRDSRPCPGWPGGAFSGHGENRLPPEEQLIPSHARIRRAEFIRLTGPQKAERVRPYGTAAAFGIAPHAFVWQQGSKARGQVPSAPVGPNSFGQQARQRAPGRAFTSTRPESRTRGGGRWFRRGRR